MSTPKTQHYVPQFILRQFLLDRDKEQVAVYDKHDDKGFVTSIKNIMAENRFHDFMFEDWIVSFESIASKIESLCLPTYERVTRTRRLDGSPDEKADLAFLIAFQLLRTRATRERMRDFETMLKDKIEATGGRIEDIPGWEPQTEDTIKRQMLTTIRETLPNYAAIIAQKDFRLAEPSPGRSFYLGDNPVCLHNARSFGPYGNLGLAVTGIEIYLPLSSNLMLCAWCPSIMEEVRRGHEYSKTQFAARLLQLHLAGRIPASTMKTEMEHMREQWKPVEEFISSVALGAPMSSDSANMDFYNSLQTANAYRYVVCQRSDFDLARRHNKEFPHLRKGRTITFG